MTSIAISKHDDAILFKIGTRIYHSAHVQMDFFWQHIIHKKITDGSVQSQEREFRINPANKILRMTYDEFNDAIYCKLVDRFEIG